MAIGPITLVHISDQLVLLGPQIDNLLLVSAFHPEERGPNPIIIQVGALWRLFSIIGGQWIAEGDFPVQGTLLGQLSQQADTIAFSQQSATVNHLDSVPTPHKRSINTAIVSDPPPL